MLSGTCWYICVFKSSSSMIFCAKICGHLMCTFCIEEDEWLKCHPKIDSKKFSIFCEPWIYNSFLLSIDSSCIFRFRWDFRRILVDFSVSDLILVIWTYFGQFWHFRSFLVIWSHFGRFWRFFSILDLFLDFRSYSILDTIPVFRYYLDIGFMRRKSTVLQLIIYLQAIYNNVDTNTDCYALYLDFSKAFDSVSHATLLAKLRLFGIGGSLLSLLSSYLSNRVQCVKLNNITSASLPVTSGVPQGSILGPLLFLVFINDLPTQVSHSQTFLYADDLELIHNNLLEMQNDILALSQWSKVNKLSFNGKKTQLISFDYRRSQNCRTDIPVLILDDHEIFLQKSVVDLGLSFSSNLAWSKHIWSSKSMLH